MAPRKYCFVPCCSSTSTKFPNKLFLTVPTSFPIRLKWFKAARRDLNKSPLSPKSHLSCCEDHFDLEEDVENYSRFKFYKEGGLTSVLKLKPDVIPHKFECQKGRSLTAVPPRRTVLTKLKQKKILHEALQATTSRNHEDLRDNTATSEGDIPTEGCSTSTTVETDLTVLHNVDTTEKSIQVNLVRPFRSKSVQVAPSTVERSSSPLPPPVKVEMCTEMTPVKRRRLESSSDCEESFSVCGSTWTETTTSSSLEAKASVEAEMWEKKSFDVTLHHLNRFPMTYIGVSSAGLKFIEEIGPIMNISLRNIFITLQKLRLNRSNMCLGNDFGLSGGQIGRIFTKTLPKLAGFMRSLIHCPPDQEIRRLLPLAFRYRYKMVQSIIDCFEVPIEKPSNPKKQALSWSEYKKGNTVKYLVSCTPNGFITYVSGGYGGRTTDTNLATHCGYLNILKPGIQVMADRGFKGLSVALSNRGITLVRPPSLPSGTQLEKNLAMQAKRIASLRIIVERVIGRIRNFKFVSSQNSVDSKLISLLDAAVVVVSALVNLQDPLFQ